MGKIGNDIWIASNTIVDEEVHIGDGVVIGTGAVVVNDIPPYAIAVGVPVKVIKYRFDPKIIQRILSLR